MEQRERRRVPLPWLLTPVIALSVAGMVGDVVGPGLITERPLLQMFINPRNRYLLLAAPQVDLVPFFLVGFFRLVLTDPLAFVLGRQYGDAALRWAEDKMGDDRGMIRKVERWFGRAAPLVILIAPSYYWCVLAGAAGMRVRLFAALNVIGTLGRLALFWVAGEAFRSELETVLEYIQRYQWWLIAASFVLVALQTRKKQERGMIETPGQLAEELAQEEAELEAERTTYPGVEGSGDPGDGRP